MSELKVSLSISYFELLPSGTCDCMLKRHVSRNSPGDEPIELSVRSRDKTNPETSQVSNCSRIS
jgi:hypothetical protein